MDEGGERLPEVGHGVEERLEVGREIGAGVGVRAGRLEFWYWEILEMDVGGGQWVPAVKALPHLAVVGGGGGVVDVDVVGGDEAAELEELVEVALCRYRHHDYHHPGRDRAFMIAVVPAIVVAAAAAVSVVKCSHEVARFS